MALMILQKDKMFNHLIVCKRHVLKIRCKIFDVQIIGGRIYLSRLEEAKEWGSTLYKSTTET